jgi:hypothetical protein
MAGVLVGGEAGGNLLDPEDRSSGRALFTAARSYRIARGLGARDTSSHVTPWTTSPQSLLQKAFPLR